MLVVEGSNSCDEYEWDDLCREIDNFTQMRSYWKAEVVNFGWMKRTGHKYFIADNAQDLLGAVLPNTECSFKVYKWKKGIAINNAHHDSPTWKEWYFISPVTETEYNEN